VEHIADPLRCLSYVQVTKLCDLGPEDCVTSVSWTQRGTHLAVGTNLVRHSRISP
jgi:hypothetical protein